MEKRRKIKINPNGSAVQQSKATFALAAARLDKTDGNGNLIVDHNKLSKTVLANGYCDAEEAAELAVKHQALAEANIQAILKNPDADVSQIDSWVAFKAKAVQREQQAKLGCDAYFAALMERYWNKVNKWAFDSVSLQLPTEDFVEWLAESLQIAFRYKAWRDPNNPLYKDPNGPDKVINRCCFSTRGRHYQCENKDKRKSNIQTVSLNTAFAEGSKEFMLDNIEAKERIGDDGTSIIIRKFITQNKLIEALVVDGIAHQDSFKTEVTAIKHLEKDSQGNDVEKRYMREDSHFDLKKLVKHLANIDQNFMTNYFCENYGVDIETAGALVIKMNTMPHQRIRKWVTKTLCEIKGNANLLSCLSVD